MQRKFKHTHTDKHRVIETHLETWHRVNVDCKTGHHAWKKCKGLEWGDEEGRMKMRGRAETERGGGGDRVIESVQQEKKKER